MGLGGTAKKLQRIADMAEDVYERLNEVRDQLNEMRQTAVETREHVDALETEVAEQRAILEAVAEQQGIDLDRVATSAHVAEAEADGDAGTDDEADAGATETGSTGSDGEGGEDADDTEDAGSTPG